MTIYIDPKTVLSPKNSVADLEVLHDGGAWKDGNEWSGWSLARMTWDGVPNAIGLRWNGEDGRAGHPNARGYATWFIVPAPLCVMLVKAVEEYKQAPKGRLKYPGDL